MRSDINQILAELLLKQILTPLAGDGLEIEKLVSRGFAARGEV